MFVDLTFRVPNPPATCPDEALLEDLLARWRDAAFVSLEDDRHHVRRGVATTALSTLFGPDLARCVHLRVHASMGDREVLGTLLRILAPDAARSPLRWRQLFARPIDMLQCIIDAADTVGARIWLDMERSISSQLRRWLSLIEQFARRSRWLLSQPRRDDIPHAAPVHATQTARLAASLAAAQATLPAALVTGWLNTEALTPPLFEQGGRVGSRQHPDTSDATWDRRVMAALEEEGNHLGACRLAIRLSDWSTVSQHISDHLEDWITQGHGPELARCLSRTPREDLAWAGMRCAVESWDVEHLRNLQPPPPQTAGQMYTLVLRAVVLGEPGDAAGWCERALEALDDTHAPLKQRLILLHARQLSHLGRHHDAAALLQPLAHTGHRMAGILWCVQRIQTEARIDELEPWLDMTETIVEDDHLVGLDSGLALLEAAVYADRMDDAQAILDRMQSHRDRPESAYEAYVGAFLALQRGDFSKVDEGIAKLSQLASSSATIDLAWRYLTCRVRLSRGPFPGIRESLEDMASRATVLSDLKHFGLARGMLLRHDLLVGHPHPPLAWPDDQPVPRRIAAMHGGAHPAVVTPRGQIRQMMLLGAQALSTGQLGVATRASASTRTLAQRHGLVLDEAEIVVLGAWLRALAGAEDLWDQALLEFAEHFRSPRHAAHHRFILALQHVDLGALEALTAVQDVAPMVARGARTALQRPSLNGQQLGAIGTALLTRMPRRWDVVIDAGPGWGLDQVRGEIWRRGSPPVNVRRSTRLRAILDTLARHGGRASKEVLHQEAWEAQDYHPLRDDKRIQVAIRDLRRRVEPDPSAPVLLLTTEDGYALNPDASFTILRAPATP